MDSQSQGETKAVGEPNEEIKPSKDRTRLYTAAVAFSLIFMIAVTIIGNQVVYAVSVDGQFIGNIKDISVLEEIKGELEGLEEHNLGAQVQFVQDIQVDEVKAWGNKLCTEDEIRDCLEGLLSVRVKAVAIMVDGEQVGIAKNEAKAQEALQGVKDHYIDATPGELVEVEVLETVELSERYVFPEAVMDCEDITELILKGTLEFKTYTVEKGDSLWSIAQDKGITVEELSAANPQLSDENRLALGEELNLTEIKPMMNVAVVKKITYEEDIKFDTNTERDASMWKWDKKIKKPGELGKKEIVSEVSYKNGIEVAEDFISETILKEPVTQVVVQGTKAEVAFRGTGRFSWPITGQITSSFGRRGNKYHTGIDICSSSGTPVHASNSGAVSYAGWSGGYGNLVIIDHGGGITTYYAHCSSISVSKGDQVEKGKVIASVGSTGRSTGPHLHFEIRVGGTPQNPINYLGK